MRIGIVGLGRMGGNIAVRLTRHGHDVVVYDRSSEVTEKRSAEPKAARLFRLVIMPIWLPD